MQEPHLSNILKSTIRNLQENVPQMISFMSSEIDQHPWERSADATYISNSEMEVNFMDLLRDMLGLASISAIFGRGLIEKYPNILEDIRQMDAGISYFLMGMPAWVPWAPSSRAFLARRRVWRGLDGLQEALDAIACHKHFDSSWGDLDDVSELILKRHAIYKGKKSSSLSRLPLDHTLIYAMYLENDFKIEERSDISVSGAW